MYDRWILGRKGLDISKIYRKKSFGIISLYMVILSAGVCAAGYYAMARFLTVFSTDAGRDLLGQNFPVWLKYMELAFQNFYLWIVPGVAGICFLLGMVGWLVLTFSLSPVFQQAHAQLKEKHKKKSGKKDFIDPRIEQDRNRRIFLHTLAVLQREGRLLDFFDEDLSLYEDEQIGAAVRSIQEDCKKAVKKYIDPRPVIDSEEGDAVTIDPGFDMDSISLVGNVAGDPPFQGSLKHRGWKAGKKEIPKLSEVQDSSIIMPAEVEIK